MALRKLGPPPGGPGRTAAKPVVRVGPPSRDGGPQPWRWHPLARCEVCPLRGCRSYVPDAGPEGALLAVVGMAPAQVEVARGRPFVGPSGGLLDRAFGLAGVPRGGVRVANRISCRPPADDLEARVPAGSVDPAVREELEARDRAVGRKKPAPSYPLGEVAAHLCRARLDRSIAGARVVLALGAFTLRGFAPHVGSLLAVRGCVMDLGS